MVTVTGRVIYKGDKALKIALHLTPGKPAVEAWARESAFSSSSPLVTSRAPSDIQVVIQSHTDKPIPTAIMDGNRPVPLYALEKDVR